MSKCKERKYDHKHTTKNTNKEEEQQKNMHHNPTTIRVNKNKANKSHHNGKPYMSVGMLICEHHIRKSLIFTYDFVYVIICVHSYMSNHIQTLI